MWPVSCTVVRTGNEHKRLDMFGISGNVNETNGLARAGQSVTLAHSSPVLDVARCTMDDGSLLSWASHSEKCFDVAGDGVGSRTPRWGGIRADAVLAWTDCSTSTSCVQGESRRDRYLVCTRLSCKLSYWRPGGCLVGGCPSSTRLRGYLTRGHGERALGVGGDSAAVMASLPRVAFNSRLIEVVGKFHR